jgi:Ca-activated chloride channel family protein
MKRLLLSITYLFIFITSICAQERVISGTVLDASGNALPGVTVLIKGTTTGTQTNFEGEFTLSIPMDNVGTHLIFSFVGMSNQEIEIGNQTNFTVTMADDTQELSEVVVVKEKSSLANRLFGKVSGLNGKRNKKKSSVTQQYPIVSNGMPSKKSDITDVITGNTEEYDGIVENNFAKPQDTPLSTFSIDVDAASYTNTRRFINNGQMPYPSAVRIEEFVNYFTYDYPNPTEKNPFSVVTEVANAPWNPQHKLVHIGLQGKKIDYNELAPSNLVFLLDVSGSMEDSNKLPLLRSSLKLLLNQLNENDKVSIVVYAGAAGLVLPPTPATRKEDIIAALNNLQAGGSTAGGQGIKLAYDIAKKAFIKNGNNRIILATDGDFNVGTSSTSELVDTVKKRASDGVFLTICGFGMGNYKDGRMEQISNSGNGNYYYIDNIKEAEKVFVKEMRATLFTIAKDVKLQVEFNPNEVQAYRLIGYENRVMAAEDFNDDTKDAGELGAGHTVTALYEIIPVGVKSEFIKNVDKLKYQKQRNTRASNSGELLTVKLRYKKPDGDKSILLSTVVENNDKQWQKSSDNFRFSAAVVEFGMLLRNSNFKSDANYKQVINLAKGAKGSDKEGYRSEFVQLVKSCKAMSSTND